MCTVFPLMLLDFHRAPSTSLVIKKHSSLEADMAWTSSFLAYETSNTTCGSPLALADSFFCRHKKVSMVNRKVTEHFLLQCTEYSCSRWINLMPYAGGDSVPIEKQLRVWQLVPCFQRANEETQLSKKTATNLRHEKECHEEDAACS